MAGTPLRSRSHTATYGTFGAEALPWRYPPESNRFSILGMGAADLACALAEQHDVRSLRENNQIEKQALVLDVVKIILQFFLCILN